MRVPLTFIKSPGFENARHELGDSVAKNLSDSILNRSGVHGTPNWMVKKERYKSL
jgi:hypothetical protein